MTNTSLVIASAVIVAVIVTGLYMKARMEKRDITRSDGLTFDIVMDLVKSYMADLGKDDDGADVPDEEWEAYIKRQQIIIKALKNCVYGIDADKETVKYNISEYLTTILPTSEAVDRIVDTSGRYIPSNVKFEIIMLKYKKLYGKDALEKWMEEYNLDRERYEIEDKTRPSYLVTDEDLDEAFVIRSDDGSFVTLGEQMSYRDKIELLTVLIWQKYKGFGVIDTVREMNINGLSAGVSGSVLYNLINRDHRVQHRAPRSVWIQFRGKYIHFRFLSFDSMEELRRVTLAIGRYGNLTQLTAKKGFKISTMYDESRVLSLRPPAAECWAFFVRKFTLSNQELPKLLNPCKVVDGDRIPMYKNTELPTNLIIYMTMAKLSMIFTGRQSTGKTTALKATVPYLDPRMTIRALEMTPEMYLRELYPERNIISVSETDHVSATSLQNALKKSDGQVTIIGEVATAEVSANMVQNGQVSSDQNLCTHHGMTTEGTIYALRNDLNAVTNMGSEIAEQQVVSVLDIDIHFQMEKDGSRYIERITEIVPLKEYSEYPEDLESATKEFYYRMTDRKSFTTREILRFDKKEKAYEVVNWFTKEITKEIIDTLPVEKVNEFKKFATDNWGGVM